ncbi:H(+)/Cl(-) exchange transporter ClcA [Rubritalea halochordaticola]|uniref:H(+)/Cl(-) exchange transporter ClcA n=1 Tax=Rubritalea halochordaticola TaxID=714537 RepID=A0ABP9UUN8_9BACT
MPKGKLVAEWLRNRLDDKQRFLVLCILIGLACGISAVLFHWSIHHLFESLWKFSTSLGGWKFYAVMVCAPGLAGLVVGLVVKFCCSDAAGSGIPQTKLAYYNRGGHISSMTGFWRFVLSSIYCGLGNSLGREGPTVHMSSAISSRLGRWMFNDKNRVRSALPVGMAAGIAAAFNAPLSAITFVFEELLDNFSMKALGGIVVAVVIAAAVSRTLLGEDPILDSHFINEEFITSPWMVVGIPMGVIAGLLGHVFVSSVLGVRGLCKNRFAKWSWLTPAVGGVCCGLVGLLALQLTSGYGDPHNSVFSIGYESLERAFEDKLVWQVIIILLVCKFVAVVLNYGTGGSGGLFSPTLYLGGMLGGLVGLLVVLSNGFFDFPDWPGAHQVIGGCVLLGMGAMFSAVVRCPFTSLIIIFEMTRNYSLILPLMAGNMLAWSISRKLRPVAIYDALLVQDGVNLKTFAAYRGSQDYRKLPVSTIMTYDVTTLDVSKTVEETVRDFGAQGLIYHSYPILNEEGELEGIVTRHEIEEADAETLIGWLITDQELLTVPPECSIRDAAQLMISKNYQQVPVVSLAQPKKLLGVITLNDIARQQNASVL